MYNKLKLKIMSERKSKNIFFIVYGLIVITMLMCSCTSTHYVCDAYAVNTDKVQEDVNELLYYVQEDSFNGNLDSKVVQIYIDKIDELNKELMYISGYVCENCDEID